MRIKFSVNAVLKERFVFNFRVRPESLAVHLPASYLAPQIFNGWSIISLCILKLEHVVLSPLPAFLGVQTISCAYRCGVLDSSQLQTVHSPGDSSLGEIVRAQRVPEPSVYILQRYTDNALLARLGPWIFADAMLCLCPSIKREGASTIIQLKTLAGEELFSATLRPANRPDELGSQAFAVLADFAQFMKMGISSYTPAARGKALARVDLHKDDASYQAMIASVEHNSLASLWQDVDMTFDSCVRATGRRYKWTYQGLFERR